MTDHSTASIKRRWRFDDQAFFMHIPKTAGSTFVSLLRTRYALDLICPFEWREYNKLLAAPDPTAWKLIRGHFPLDYVNHLPQRPVILSFLREPTARMISDIDQAQRDPRHQLHRKISDFANIPLHDLLTNPEVLRVFANKHTVFLTRPNFGMGDATHLDVDLAKANLETLDFVGITEMFDRSLELLVYTFDFAPIAEYASRNISPRRASRRDSLSQEELAMLTEYNQLDNEVYAFGIALFEARYAKMQAEIAAGYVPRVAEAERVTQIDYDFSQVDIGSNWYPAESSPQGGYMRWSGPGTSSSVSLPPLKLNQDYELSFRINKAVSERVLASLRVLVNNQPVSLSYTQQGPSPMRRLYTAQVSRQMLAQHLPHLTRVSFEVDETLDSSMINSAAKNVRPIGVQLHWLKFTPVAFSG
jgi:hypothetical protein